MSEQVIADEEGHKLIQMERTACERGPVYGLATSADGSDTGLLQPKAFLHQPLQSWLIEEIEGEFFVGEHGKGGALGSGGQFGRFFHREVGVLSDDGQDSRNVVHLMHPQIEAVVSASHYIQVWQGNHLQPIRKPAADPYKRRLGA